MRSLKKIVLVGGKGSGKTSLYNCISGDEFNFACAPTLKEENSKKIISVNGQKVIKLFLYKPAE